MLKETTSWENHVPQAFRAMRACGIFMIFCAVTLVSTGAEARRATPANKPAVNKPAPTRLTVKKTSPAVKHAGLPAPATSRNSPKLDGISLLKKGDARQVRTELEKYIGTRYKPGGTGNGGFDCSGFARSMYQKLYGIDLPHNAQSQFQLPASTRLSLGSLRTGDLVFFSPTTSKKRINHVGIYLDDGQFIHAESNRGITISNIDDEHWRERLVSAKGFDGKKLFKQQELPAWIDPDEQEEIENEVTGLQVHYSSKDKPPSQSPEVLAKSSSQKKQQFIELDYIRPVFGKYCNLQLGSFREDFDVYGGSAADMADVARDTYGSYALYSYTQGIRIASDIRPVQWMSITPTLMYYSQGRELENFYQPSRSLGVDMSLGSLPDSGWSLSTGLKYETLSTSALRRATRVGGDPSQIDFSFTYSQQLSRRAQLSLMGQTLRSSFSQRSEEPGVSAGADQRVFFMLNYNY